MPWSRIDDDFYDHPKIVAAGPCGIALFVCGLSYCNRYLTDGFIPAAQVKRLIDVDDPLELAEHLVSVGLFEPADGGYQIHDYLDYNPSAAETKRQREANAKRQAEWRGQRKAPDPEQDNGQDNKDTNSVTNGVTDSVTNIAPIPIPIPIPNPKPKKKTPTVAQAPEQPPPKRTAAQATFSALAALCQVDIATCTKEQRGALNQSEASLRKAGAMPDMLGVRTDDWQTFAHWWYRHDWRGKKGEPPRPHQVREEWGKFTSWREGQRVETALPPEQSTLTPDEQLWQEILADVQGRMTRETFNAHLLGSVPVSRNDGCLRVALAREDSAVWLRERLYDKVIHPCLEQHEPGLNVEFMTNET